MKKSFYFALALTAGLFASCSSDEIAQAPQSGLEIDENAPAPIEIGVKNDISLTRGTGTVGHDPTTDASTYGWDGQTFFVSMLKKGSLDYAKMNDNAATAKWDAVTNPYVYKDSVFQAPLNGAANQNAFLKSGITAYYPTDGVFDFWAYRIDDASSVAAPGSISKYMKLNGTAMEDANDSTDAQYIVAPIAIDGSQDIMIADVAASETAGTSGWTNADLYSAKTGRRGIKPLFTFKHLLTRLKFNVIAGSKAVSNEADDLAGYDAWGNEYFKGFKVTKITVHSAKTGNLIVAYKGDAIEDANRIVWEEPAAAWTPDNDGNVAGLAALELKSRSLEVADGGKAVGTFMTAGNPTQLTLDGTQQIGTTGKYFQESTPLWSKGTTDDLDEKTGRPNSVCKTAKQWKDEGYTQTVYYWNETTEPTFVPNSYDVSANLETLAPVVPKWNNAAETTYTWDAYTGAYYKWTENTAHADDGSEVDLTAAPVDGIVAPAGIDPDASKVYEYNDGTTSKYYNVTTTLAEANLTDGAADPTESTVGAVGDVKRNGSNYFQCTAVNNTGEGVKTAVGEALLVAPAPADGYKVTVYYSHYKQVNATKCELDQNGTVTKQIKLQQKNAAVDTPIAFKPGKQYTITIKLFEDGTAGSNVTVGGFEDDNDGELQDEYDFE